MGSPGVESRARVAEGRALGLGSVRAVPVEPACGPGQRVVEEPWVGRRVKQSMVAEGFEKVCRSTSRRRKRMVELAKMSSCRPERKA